MKRLKKILLVFICAALAAFGMTGCAETSSQKESEAQDEIIAKNIEDITNYTQNNFATLMQEASYEQFAAYEEGGNTLVSIPFDNDWGTRWKEFYDEYGDVAEATALTATRTDGVYSDQIILTSEGGDQMVLTITYNDQMTPVSTQIGEYSDDSKETLGSKMGTAGVNTATGLIVVFIVLVFLCLVISCFKFIGNGKKPENKDNTADGKKVSSPAPAAAQPAEEETVDLAENEELVAVIAAAIAAAEEKPVEGFQVRSIRRLRSNKWR